MDTIKAGENFSVESLDSFNQISQSEERFEALIDFSVSQLQTDYFGAYPERKKYIAWDVFDFMDWIVGCQIARRLEPVVLVINEDVEVTFSLEREEETSQDAAEILLTELKAEENRLKLSDIKLEAS